MRLKDETRRVRISAVDPHGKAKSKTITIYDATPEEAIELVRQAIRSDSPVVDLDSDFMSMAGRPEHHAPDEAVCVPAAS